MTGCEGLLENRPDGDNLLILGWREWLALPELGIPAIKAKLDTGARSSSLHTFQLETFRENGRLMVRFGIHPLQKRTIREISCTAEVMDRRIVTDSGGHPEERWVIATPVVIGTVTRVIEITLTNRDSMRFRMLLGRTAMTGGICVNSDASYTLGTSLRKAYSRKRENPARNVQIMPGT